jgi:Holliday junction resolvase RusA-like endonuclease
MATTKPLYITSGGQWEVCIPLAPVPASRPRVGRWSTYYPKRYQTWKDAAHKELSRFSNTAVVTDGPLEVVIEVVAEKPKKPSRFYPHPDIDNYAKAAMDAITSAQLVWEDDKQVVGLRCHKRYARDGETPHTMIHAVKMLPVEAGQDVYDLPDHYRVSLEEVEDESCLQEDHHRET